MKNPKLRVEKLNELRKMFEQHIKQCTGSTRQETVRTISLQQYELERHLIAVYSRKRSVLSRFISRFFSWAVTKQCEAALTYHIPVVMSTQKPREELNNQYGTRIVDQPLSV